MLISIAKEIPSQYKTTKSGWVVPMMKEIIEKLSNYNDPITPWNMITKKAYLRQINMT